MISPILGFLREKSRQERMPSLNITGLVHSVYFVLDSSDSLVLNKNA